MKIMAEKVHEALLQRKSVRAYLDKHVSNETIVRILTSAAQSPSGNNIQPWCVNVLTGAALKRLSSAIIYCYENSGAPSPEYDYYPTSWPEPHLSRRRQNGWALYEIIGINRGDVEGVKSHHKRNYSFFGAPIGLIFSVDRRLGDGAYIDIGLFMQALSTAAVAEGLATCMQAIFAPYHSLIREQLDLDHNQKVICGMSLGYEDTSAIINSLQTPRVPVSEFARFHEL
tara:strand:+ start:18014 stop:18697 length:684 start_codon:yes stop_codon:yes gene_type:complete